MKLNKLTFKTNDNAAYARPVFCIVMDGIGIAPDTAANAVKNARTPVLDMLMSKYPTLKLKAHGTAVGLPSDDDMGNSEVGHNALGAGQVFAQGSKLVTNSIETGKMFESQSWKDVIRGNTMHFLGLFSDGNVHSHIDHLKAMIERAKKDGVKKVRIHILIDGRDVGETSALDYILPFEEFLASVNDSSFDAKIASGGGRMNITMDRYEANWAMVEKGWHTHVLGEGRQFASAEEAVKTFRAESPVIDQDLP
ncbi:MAG: 2,3-bisphosphoglycerate-independent phosphoglycerate mutase, partial [Clostridia bacterium]|nr:2,3-bisphosphoglycerate-independent phosphoglycerate mutase [Clostridia bacterium]